jgi:hypothetical protein
MWKLRVGVGVLCVAGVVSGAQPTWDTTVADPTLTDPFEGLTPLRAEHKTVFYANNDTFGGYNHGAIIARNNGTFFVSWYNGVMDESAANRVLYATSVDGDVWSEPAILFNTTAGTHHSAAPADVSFPLGYEIGLESEAWVQTPDGHLYGLARYAFEPEHASNEPLTPISLNSSWDVFQRKTKGADHTGPDVALMRRVLFTDGVAALGSVFWLADAVPKGFDTYCNRTQADMDDATRYTTHHQPR